MSVEYVSSLAEPLTIPDKLIKRDYDGWDQLKLNVPAEDLKSLIGELNAWTPTSFLQPLKSRDSYNEFIGSLYSWQTSNNIGSS